MPKAKTILVLAAASAAAFGAYRWHTSSTDNDRGLAVIDRVWIDHVPRSETETINVFIALSKDVAGQPTGIFQKSSAWRGAYELFKYETRRGRIVATFPQTKETEEITAKATRCDEGGMDFCLELDGASRGVKKYYSRKGWEIEGGASTADIESRIDQIEASAPRE